MLFLLMTDRDIKEKAVFVVGLLAAFLAFSFFKDDLSQKYLLIANQPYSLWHSTVFFVILLAISVYLYALNYIRYSFGRFQNFFVFRWIIPTANFFYSLAILYPIIVLIAWVLGSEPIYGFALQHQKAMGVFDIVATLVALALAGADAFFSRMRQKREEAQSIEANKVSYLERAIRLIDQGFYGEALMEAQKVLEQYLREKLLSKEGSSPRFVSMRQLVQMAEIAKIVDAKHIAPIKDLQDLRNKAAHSSDPVTKAQADFGLRLVKQVLENQ